MISYANVTVQYPRTAVPTTHDISFDAPAGHITALAGPNGSGKSTLVRALLRGVPLIGGAIRVNDTDITTLSPRALARAVAVVTQREDQIFPRSVREYLALGRYPHETSWSGSWGTQPESHAAVERAAARADVTHFLDRRTDELSGGEWQRVRIARVLVQEAPVLVLDEPTTFLDVAHEMATFELLATLAREGTAVLLVSHQLNLVARFAQQIVLLARGRVVASGTPDVVMRGDVLEPVYEWPLVVTRDPAINAPALVPLRRRG